MYAFPIIRSIFTLVTIMSYEENKKEYAVVVRNLSFRYSNQDANVLESVNLDIKRGEKVAIVGPNGAGKTTLLLNVNGILRGYEGHIEIFGRRIDGRRSRKEIVRDVGMVFQDPDDQLFMPTVFDDVAFGPLNLGLSEDEVRTRVKEALRMLHIEDYEDKNPHRLSFGEKKKIALATVLAMKPRILLLDEPTANLDPRSRSELISILKWLNESNDFTMIIATHDVNAIPDIADRVFVLNRRIIAEGTPREIFSDAELMEKTNLEVPDVMKLFELLRCFGFNCDELPLSIDDAVEALTKIIETSDGRHIHLHIHEHTHHGVERLRERWKYEHHL